MNQTRDDQTAPETAPDVEPTTTRPTPPAYHPPRLRQVGTLKALQGRSVGREYDGPGRWYFDGY
jgi:hypothetical protein